MTTAIDARWVCPALWMDSGLMSFRLALSCLVLSCLVLSCLVLSCLVLSCLVLPCLALGFSDQNAIFPQHRKHHAPHVVCCKDGHAGQCLSWKCSDMQVWLTIIRELSWWYQGLTLAQSLALSPVCRETIAVEIATKHNCRCLMPVKRCVAEMMKVD